ncbi:E3 ubiquitin-protein ligase E3D, partial [Aplochiton taeniatus]
MSMAGSENVGLFLELRKKLHSGLLILGSDVAGCPPEVNVTGGEASLQVRTPEGLLYLQLPAEVSLEEGSCVQTAVGELRGEQHFRLRLNVDQRTEEDVSRRAVMERLQPGESYCFHCQACGTRLLEDRVFKRVLPLPNGNWNALVDDWCCHPDPFANNAKLLPRAEDCLLGDTYLLVARESGCEDTMTQELRLDDETQSQESKKPCRRRTLISCQSCSSGLGEAVTPGTLKLYITEVLVEAGVGDSRGEALLNRADFLERTMAGRLLELSNAQSTFRFSIQTPDEKAVLLLWVLNSDSIVASLPGDVVRGQGPAGQRPAS